MSLSNAPWIVLIIVVPFVLGGCEVDNNISNNLSKNLTSASQSGTVDFPPIRSAWETASPPARAAHARAVHTALMTARRDPVSWSAGGTSGTVSVANMADVDKTICRGFYDQITTNGTTHNIRDIACWGDGWFLLRDPNGIPVLAPAFAESERVYTIKSGGTLGAVARRTGASVAELQALNPGHPKRLSRGTPVLLP